VFGNLPSHPWRKQRIDLFKSSFLARMMDDPEDLPLSFDESMQGSGSSVTSSLTAASLDEDDDDDGDVNNSTVVPSTPVPSKPKVRSPDPYHGHGITY